MPYLSDLAAHPAVFIGGVAVGAIGAVALVKGWQHVNKYSPPKVGGRAVPWHVHSGQVHKLRARTDTAAR